jgi:hypothetical protein
MLCTTLDCCLWGFSCVGDQASHVVSLMSLCVPGLTAVLHLVVIAAMIFVLCIKILHLRMSSNGFSGQEKWAWVLVFDGKTISSVGCW